MVHRLTDRGKWLHGETWRLEERRAPGTRVALTFGNSESTEDSMSGTQWVKVPDFKFYLSYVTRSTVCPDSGSECQSGLSGLYVQGSGVPRMKIICWCHVVRRGFLGRPRSQDTNNLFRRLLRWKDVPSNTETLFWVHRHPDTLWNPYRVVLRSWRRRSNAYTFVHDPTWWTLMAINREKRVFLPLKYTQLDSYKSYPRALTCLTTKVEYKSTTRTIYEP